MSRPARERKVQLCWEVAARLAKLEQGLSEWRIAVRDNIMIIIMIWLIKSDG